MQELRKEEASKEEGRRAEGRGMKAPPEGAHEAPQAGSWQGAAAC